jgi:hypothetical protein
MVVLLDLAISRDLPEPRIVIHNLDLLAVQQPFTSHICVLIGKPALEVNKYTVKFFSFFGGLADNIDALDFTHT